MLTGFNTGFIHFCRVVTIGTRTIYKTSMSFRIPPPPFCAVYDSTKCPELAEGSRAKKAILIQGEAKKLKSLSKQLST